MFNIIYKCDGGYYDPEEEGMGSVFGSMLMQLSNAVFFHERKIEKHPAVYLGFINKHSFGAVVKKHKGEYFIGINIGCFYILDNLFNRIMSFNNNMIEYGDISKEREAEKIYNPHTLTIMHLFLQDKFNGDARPVCNVRRILANFFVLVSLRLFGLS